MELRGLIPQQNCMIRKYQIIACLLVHFFLLEIVPSLIL